MAPLIHAAQLHIISLGAGKGLGFLRHPLIRILLAVLFLVPAIALNNLFSYQVLDRLDEPFLSMVQFPKAVLLIWALMFLYRRYCLKVEGRPAYELSGTAWHREFGIGTLLGAGMVILIVGLLAVFGAYRVESVNGPQVLLGRLFRYGQGAFIEDLLFTVIIFRLLEELAGTVIAYVLVSLLFGGLHLLNDFATPTGGLFIAIQEITLLAPFILTRRLWMTWGVHLFWNYFQSGVFGLNNSGMAHHGFLEPVVTGPVWLTGGEFGIESSVVGLAINLAVGVPLLLMAIGHKQIVSPPWSRENQVAS
jgi:membrane protease YdiL (CAAX protease family)